MALTLALSSSCGISPAHHWSHYGHDPNFVLTAPSGLLRRSQDRVTSLVIWAWIKSRHGPRQPPGAPLPTADPLSSVACTAWGKVQIGAPPCGWHTPSWQKSKGPSFGHAATEPTGTYRARNEMSPLRAARPDDMPLTVTTLSVKMELHNAHPGIEPHHPEKQRPFLSWAGDFIIHSRTAGSLGEASLPPGLGQWLGNQKRSTSGPWTRSGERIWWERGSCTSRP